MSLFNNNWVEQAKRRPLLYGWLLNDDVVKFSNNSQRHTIGQSTSTSVTTTTNIPPPPPDTDSNDNDDSKETESKTNDGDEETKQITEQFTKSMSQMIGDGNIINELAEIHGIDGTDVTISQIAEDLTERRTDTMKKLFKDNPEYCKLLHEHPEVLDMFKKKSEQADANLATT